MKDLKELAAQYGLETIAVNVIGESGLRDAIVNFTTMQQAEDFAYKHGLLVDKFENKGGKSSFYEPCGYYPENGFNIYDAYREKYTCFCKGDAESFQETDIDEMLDILDFDNETEKNTFIVERERVKERIQNLADDEFIYYDGDSFFSQPMKKNVMRTSDRGNTYIIGVW